MVFFEQLIYKTRATTVLGKDPTYQFFKIEIQLKIGIILTFTDK